MLITSPGLALAQSAFAEGFYDERKLETTLIRAVGYCLVGSLFLTVLVILTAPLVPGLFGIQPTQGVISALRVMAYSGPFATLNGLLMVALRVRKQVQRAILVSLVVALISLAYPVVMIKTMGIVSIALGWLLAQALTTVILGIDLARSKAYQSTTKVVTREME